MPSGKCIIEKNTMCRLLFGDESIDFNVYAEDLAYLHANGVVDNIEGYAGILAPLYSKCIITAFRPIYNGERRHYGLSANVCIPLIFSTESPVMPAISSGS